MAHLLPHGAGSALPVGGTGFALGVGGAGIVAAVGRVGSASLQSGDENSLLGSEDGSARWKCCFFQQICFSCLSNHKCFLSNNKCSSLKLHFS